MLKLHHHGAASGVTGSCHQLYLDDQHSILVDCGLFQGDDLERRSPDGHHIDFDLDQVQALIVTHCHIDHIGRIPYLLAAGFRGPILCSQASAYLLPLILEDAIKLGFTRDRTLVSRFLDQIRAQLQPLDYHHWHALPSPAIGMVRLRPAGHILGSSIVEVALPNKKRIVFSGDLGCYNTPLLPDPDAPESADLLVLESTYGNRCHEHRAERSQKLKQILQSTLKNGGVTLIPAFSIGRTQELLYEIEDLLFHLNGDQIMAQVPIIVDSPLAAKITSSYRQLQHLWDKEARHRISSSRHPLDFDHLITIDDHRQHQALLNRLQVSAEPAIVIAASGMCSGGRIVNYLKALAPDPRTDIVFVGYQAKGTLGRRLQQLSAPTEVEIDGQLTRVEASIHTLSGYSAHADQPDLIRFVSSMAFPPKCIRLIHGSPVAQKGLANCLKRTFPGIKVELAATLASAPVKASISST
ncbi:MBL fold metallo-hydrolase RNA specificity domain-containing protein [Ferrimonas kyonanensis]|uniref:MBL fold metallo-hydrolase RNA specificity domain-containing protein n=1 Tax=Ferrimonas kyonanensis TaxID=364763 RepID=UPI00041D037C|nr:MBL fold metallo-hydrolase [Ferrimonas kyonanensis]